MYPHRDVCSSGILVQHLISLNILNVCSNNRFGFITSVFMDDSGRASEGSNAVPNNGLIEPANQPIFSQGI